MSADIEELLQHKAAGNECYKVKDYEGAIADYGEAIRLNRNHAVAFYNRGLARNAVGDNAGAVADYDQAIRLDPDLGRAQEPTPETRPLTGRLRL